MYAQWLTKKEQIKKLTEELHELEANIWLAAEKKGQLNPQGSKTFEDSGFKVTITHGETVKVDQELAARNPELFKMKYEFSKTDYKQMVDAQRNIVNEAITITPSKPQFKIVRVEE